MQQPRRQAGLTLIELMVAMVLGLLVAAGIVVVFTSTSASNQAQKQMANLQENGRYAVFRVKQDIGMANAQYCNGSGGNAHASTAGPYLDNLRAPTVYAHSDTANLLLSAMSDLTTSWGGNYPAKPDAVFSLPSFLSMRGYDCTKDACTPVDPHDVINAIPKMGKAVGDRVIGSSVLTLRYLDPSMGWSIGRPDGSTVTANADGTLKSVNLSPLSGEPAVADFKSTDLGMLASCSVSQIFAVTNGGTTKVEPSSTNNFAQPSAQSGSRGLRFFDFNRAYKTVTYYLQVVDAGNGTTSGALIRREDGVDHEMVRGIERLNFKYGILNAAGQTQFLTANQVDTATDAGGGSVGCPSTVTTPPGGVTYGCLWRAVKSIEVDMLVDGQTPLHALKKDELAYTYSADGITTPKDPDQHTIKPNADQGFPKHLLRREFTALIAVRNYNP